jgi:hypothetical protein
LIQIKLSWFGCFSIAEKPGGIAVSDFCYSRPVMQRFLQQAEAMDQMMQCVGVKPVRAARIDRGMGTRRGPAASPAFMIATAVTGLAKQVINPKHMGKAHEPAATNNGKTLATPHAQPSNNERA